MSDPIYVEKDPSASNAKTVFAGRRYWLAGYCEGDGIWSDDAIKASAWSNDTNAGGIWSNDSDASVTWTDD